MSWTDHLNSLTGIISESLFETEAKSPKSPIKQYVVPSTASVGPAQVPANESFRDSVPEFLSKLRTELGTNDVITKYESTLSALNSTIPDETTRIRTALVVLSTTAGIQAEHVLEAYKSRSVTLAAESNEFTSLIDKRYSNEISSRHTQAASISQQLESKKAEIDSLITQYQTVTGEIAAQKNKLDAARAGFSAAADIVRSETESVLSKLAPLLSQAAIK